MNSKIGLSEKETAIIRKRYPIVDLECLELPPIGLSTITSLDYLESAIKFDISNNSGSSDLTEALLNISEKIDIYRKEH